MWWRPTPSSPRACGWRSGAWPSARSSSTTTPRGSRARGSTRYETAGRPRFVAGSIGPDRQAAVVRRPDAVGLSPSTSWPRCSASRRTALIEAARMCCWSRRAGHPGGQGAPSTAPAQAFEPPGGAVPSRRRSCSTRPAACCSAPTSPPCSTILEALRADVIGLNCSTGPEHMREPVRYLGENVAPADLGASPTPGMPLDVDGEAVYPMEPEPLADAAWRSSCEERRQRGRRLLRHDARAHRAAASSGVARPAPQAPRRSTSGRARRGHARHRSCSRTRRR